MPDAESVANARKKVGAAFTALLKDISDRQISQAGSKKTRDQLPAISTETGVWRDDGVDSKPLAWLVHFNFDRQTGSWKALLPGVAHAGRLTGTFNTKSPLQGLLCRVIPVVRLDAAEAGGKATYETHPYWEWALSFVFPGLATFAEGGSSGATIDFNPTTGRLESTVDGRAIEQPYVSAGLFTLNSADDAWRIGDLTLTYAQASEALAEIISVQPVVPSAPVEEEQ